MDMLKISSSVMKGLLNMILNKALQKKLGYKIDILINDLDVKVIDGKVHLHASVDAETDTDELTKIVKSAF